MLISEPIFDVQELNSTIFENNKIRFFVARLDQIHPVVSGNKMFKLFYFIKEATLSNVKIIKTFGGAYSNHLVATAYLCKQARLKSIGVVRGEKPAQLSHTLQHCIKYGMELEFISRDDYAKKSSTPIAEEENPPSMVTIPEGGFHPLGAKGAALIMNHLKTLAPTHICTAVGTATTMAGLVLAKQPHQKIIGIPVLKNMSDLAERLTQLLHNQTFEMPVIFDSYHRGGYAKYDEALINFMNEFFEIHQIPTDFVYTAKSIIGIFDQISKGYFPANSKIVFLHTGGLQGNLSLPPGTLVF